PQAIVGTTVPTDRRAHTQSPVFNDRAATDIYTLSLHDALPISDVSGWTVDAATAKLEELGLTPIPTEQADCSATDPSTVASMSRSEEHTSELQSRENLVCRLLLEKKKLPPTTARVPTSRHARWT